AREHTDECEDEQAHRGELRRKATARQGRHGRRAPRDRVTEGFWTSQRSWERQMQHNPYSAPVAAPAMGGQLATGRYEFSPVDAQPMQQTGVRSRIWGIISLVLGGLILLLAGIVLVVSATTPQVAPLAAASFALAPVGLVYLAIGWFYIAAGGSLAAVAESQG